MSLLLAKLNVNKQTKRKEKTLGSDWKAKHFWRQIGIYHAISFTILSVNQWEILANEFTLDFDTGYRDAAYIQNDRLCTCLLKYFLAPRLVRSYLNVETIAFKLFLIPFKLLSYIANLLNHNCF